MRAWANVAKLTETKARSGGLVARCAAGLPFLLSEGVEVAFVPPQLDLPRTGRVQHVRPVAEDAAVVTFDTVDSLDQAEGLVGCFCLVRPESLPDEAQRALDEACIDLAGYEVWDAALGFVGTVTELVENPAQDLLAVTRSALPGEGALPAAEDDAPEVLVPFVDALVEDIDHDTRRISVNLPDGLLDL